MTTTVSACETRDPFDALLGIARGVRPAGEPARPVEHDEPTVPGLAAKGAAVIAHFAPAYLGRELSADDPELTTAASDLITNILHAVAHRHGAEQAAATLGVALCDLLCERLAYDPHAERAEPDRDEVLEHLDTLADTALRRSGNA